MHTIHEGSGVASPKTWEAPKNFVASKMLDFWRITLFCLEKRLSRHKMTIFSRNFFWGAGAWPLWPPLPTPIHEGIYTVIKLPRNGNCKTKKLIKNNSGFGSWWNGNIWWFLHSLSIRKLMQDNAGRSAFPTFFKKDWILHFMTFQFWECRFTHVCYAKV